MPILRAYDHRHDSGFTLMELLVVIALMAILMAIAIPVTLSVQRSLRLSEMDNTAKQIYMTAQNRVTALQSTGQRETMRADVESAGVKEGMPSDYPDTSVDWSKYGLFAIDGSMAATSTYIVTEDAASVTSGMLSGTYIIELSPSTSEVYGVFYSEQTDLSAADAASLPRDRAGRMDGMIGYYGGNEIDRVIASSEVTLDDVAFKVINSEELYVAVTSDDFKLSTFDQSKLKIEVDVTGADATNPWSGTPVTITKTYTGGRDFTLDGNTNEVDVILDSMRTDKDLSFASFTDHRIVPGTDISVQIKVTYGTDTPHVLPQQTGINSLFESLSTDSSGSVRASISCLRHLNNLRTSKFYTVSTEGTINPDSYVDGMNKYSMVDIAKDIDFDGTTWQPTSVSLQSRSAGVIGYNPLSNLTPIKLPNTLTGSSTSTIDGGSHKLANFIIGASGAEVENTGLFSQIGCAVTAIDFVDPQVFGGNSTGTLAGTMLNAGETISDCHVTVTKTGDDGNYLFGTYKVTGYSTPDATWTTGVGGLIGRCEGGTIEDCSAGLDVDGGNNVGGLVGWMKGGASMTRSSAHTERPDIGDATMRVPLVTGHYYYAGGLIGRLAGGEVTDSFASIDVRGGDPDSAGSTFGGLIGIATSYPSVSGCYSSGHVTCDGDHTQAGGLIGLIQGGNYTYCYSTSNVDCNASAGGFAGRIENWAWLANNASYGQVLMVDGSVDTGSANDSHGFVGVWVSGTYGEGCVYLRENGYNDAFSEYGQPGYLSYDDLATGGVGESHPYAAQLQGKSFPFGDITGLGVHYGDWPIPVTVNWNNGAGDTIETSTTLSGAIPTFSSTADDGTLVTPDYRDGDIYHFWDGGWNPSVDRIGSDTTYTATYDDYVLPDVSLILASTQDITVSGIPCSSLYNFLNADARSTGTVGVNRRMKKDAEVDSTAPLDRKFANVPTNIATNTLTPAGFDVSAFDWEVYITNGTYFAIDGRNGYNANGSTSGNYLVFIGEPIDATTKTTGYRVVEYDVGRATSGSPAYRWGTISLKKISSSGFTYYSYNPSTFSPASEWVSL